MRNVSFLPQADCEAQKRGLRAQRADDPQGSGPHSRGGPEASPAGEGERGLTSGGRARNSRGSWGLGPHWGFQSLCGIWSWPRDFGTFSLRPHFYPDSAVKTFVILAPNWRLVEEDHRAMISVYSPFLG